MLLHFTTTVKPRFNEPQYNKVLGITNDIFQPGNSVMYGKEPRYNKPISQSLGTSLSQGSTVETF